MNKWNLLIAVTLLTATAKAQVAYTVKGTVPGSYPAVHAVIGYPDHGKYLSDTVVIRDGKFEFTGKVGRPELAEIDLIIPRTARERRPDQEGQGEGSNSSKDIALFYLEGNVDVTFDTAGIAKVTGGGREQAIFQEYFNSISDKSDAAERGMDFFQEKVSGFVKKYPDSYVSVDLMELFAASIQPAIFEPMYNALSQRMKKVDKVVGWKKQLDQAKEFESGKMAAMDFTMNDKDGKPVSLSSYKGSYVLLDFWASWCGPCRAENPNVLAAYEKFKGKNFRILAVSLDDKKSAWLKAIEEDKLPWTQLSDLKGSDNKAAKLYGVTSIPQNFLINPEGKIIGQNLRGKELEERLSKILL